MPDTVEGHKFGSTSTYYAAPKSRVRDYEAGGCRQPTRDRYLAVGERVGPVSAHVLASAAAEITAVLHKAQGGVPIRSAMLDSMTGEHQGQIAFAMTEAFNFMKHGAKDPNAVLRFNPGESEWVIYAACVDYLAAFGVAPPEALLFLVHMTDQRPELIRKDVDDPFRSLREQERIKSGGKKIERRHVAKSLVKFRQFAEHLLRTGQHDHPLIRTSR